MACLWLLASLPFFSSPLIPLSTITISFVYYPSFYKCHSQPPGDSHPSYMFNRSLLISKCWAYSYLRSSTVLYDLAVAFNISTKRPGSFALGIFNISNRI
ncbi:uncharacterized protein LY79DRAFT_574355 [Colletotrichum navitas]|uniref:Uncharacterized protein n=1 Tax=Colletotrichum navitas TaxID=681940 RepID=A0AAD8UTM7_9PEZI|nr:uncharacterized protein LY79DRAFT_574355 [Colletotrichum navitas]KAK1558150.1 hypothetical protein LY79DRAFT_574355 [Colletotrichum navitas]